jgi:hypothetical protein
MGQFPNCEIKLCDLEVARVIQEGEDIREIIGTPDYVGKSFCFTWKILIISFLKRCILHIRLNVFTILNSITFIGTLKSNFFGNKPFGLSIQTFTFIPNLKFNAVGRPCSVCNMSSGLNMVILINYWMIGASKITYCIHSGSCLMGSLWDRNKLIPITNW